MSDYRGSHRRLIGKHRAWPRTSRLALPAALAFSVLTSLLILAATAVPNR